MATFKADKKEQKPKKKIAPFKIIIVIIILGILSTLFFWQLFVKNAVNQPRLLTAQGSTGGDKFELTTEDIYQPLTITDQMDSIFVYFSNTTSGLAIGEAENVEIHTTLSNEDNEVVAENTLALSLQESGFKEVISGMSSLPEGRYTLAIKNLTQEETPSRAVFLDGGSSEEFTQSNSAYTKTTDGATQELGGVVYLTINSAKTYTLLGIPYLLLQILFWGVVVVVYLMIFVWKVSWPKMLTTIMAMMCFIFLFLNTPGATPDETMHYGSAFHVSNAMLFVKEEEEGILVRPCDAEVNFPREGKTSIQTYAYFYNNFFKTTSDSPTNNLVIKGEVVPKNIGEWFNYFPAAIGITMGRVLHIGGVGTYMLARLMTTITFLVLFYFAMKRLPFGQNTFFAIACFPMFLQEVSSVSYDALILGLVYFTVAEVLNYTYTKNTVQIKLPEKIIVILCFFLLGSLKSGLYSLVPAALIVPYIIRQLKNKNKKEVGKSLLMLAILFMGIIFFAILTRGRVTPGIDGTTYNGFPVWRADGSTLLYSVKSIVTHPLEMIKLFYNTFFKTQFLFLLNSSINNLGWFNLEVNGGIVFLYLLTGIFSAVSYREETLFPTRPERIWWAISSLGFLVCVTVALLITWTPYLYSSASGIQGRYLLPFLPIALFTVFRNRKIQYQKNYKVFLVFWLLFLFYISWQSFLNITLNRYTFT